MRRWALSGGRWTALQQIGLQAVGLATTSFLARILTPEAFGLVALVMVVLGLFSLVNQFGWSASLVVRSKVNTEIISTVFWAACGFGIVVASVLLVAAGPVAVLFGIPSSADLLRAIATILALEPPAAVARALLMRELRFGSLALVALLRQGTYAVAAVFLALEGLGVWSVVIGRIAGAILGLALGVLLAHLRPRFVFRVDAFRLDFFFNAGFLANRLSSYVGKNIDYWTVSRFLGDGPLGLYYIAYVIPNIVRQRVTWAVQTTLLPLVSRIRELPDQIGTVWEATLEKSLLLLAPLLVGLALLARPFLELVFGEPWVDASGPMSTLALAAGVEIAVALAGSLITAVGKPHLMAGANTIRAAVIGLLATIAARSAGLTGVAAVVLFGGVATAGLGLLLLRREFGIPFRATARAVRPVVLPTLAMIAVVRLVMSVAPLERPPAQLAIAIPTGALVYLMAGFGFYRSRYVALTRDVLGILGLGRERSGA